MDGQVSLPKAYDPQTMEPRIQAFWNETSVYAFDPSAEGTVFSIDTPPATVSGNLHLGHVYSYTHADVLARFRRMNGFNVFYPMGFDDNGLPTEKLVERLFGITPAMVGRSEFIRRCLEASVQAEEDYRALWQRLGLSIDWRYTYRTIDALCRRAAQWSFLDHYRKGFAYRQDAPAIWCPADQTAIAQAELADIERETTFYTLAFTLEDGTTLPIATTRPELLPACVAVFVHPDDPRYAGRAGQHVTTPLGDQVPMLTDSRADPEKGTGAVMCCTFGDTTDVEWWREYHLPLRIILGRDGRLTDAAGKYWGLTVAEARERIVADLASEGKVLGQEKTRQSVRVHERDDVPVEYIVTPQWFIKTLVYRDRLIQAGERISWQPPHMGTRYREWVENLRWDWGISRQRTFGVPFPVWYCDQCGNTLLANEDQLPVDPTETPPPSACERCGGTSFTPERDVMDTWATSSLSPQIVGGFFDDPARYERVFPFSLRPQAHEIIRTWAFYTILQSMLHFDAIPWTNATISGWGLAPEGAGKISKSRGSATIGPNEVMTRYSADAARYWATSTGPGKDAIISEEKMRNGLKLATKLWNIARFSERFVRDVLPAEMPPELSPADRWLLSRMQRIIRATTEALSEDDWATAKAEVEAYFWRELADNYLEMAKGRLYDESQPGHEAARATLRRALLTMLQLFAPFLPYVTEAIYQSLFAASDGEPRSVHRSRWPSVDEALIDEAAEAAGEAMVTIASAVRRYKSEASLSLGAEIARLDIETSDAALAAKLALAEADLRSVTRARTIDIRVVPAGETEGEPDAVRVRVAA